jgi:NB-ARC domain
MGKTTLARRLFDDLVYEYPGAAAFVEVGQNGDTQQALRMVLQELGSDHAQEGSLAAQLQAVLSGNASSLLVLDNLWTAKHLNDILPEVPPGTRVIVTTRNTSVLNCTAGRLSKGFGMPVLSHSAALHLFRHHTAFSSGEVQVILGL